MSNFYIPYDMICCILVRFSVKDLMKLKCVSKLWLSIIESPEFIKFHIMHHSFNSKSQKFILANFRSYVSGFMPFPEMFRKDLYIPAKEIICPGLYNENYNVVGISRGIFCIRYTQGGGIYLFNPWIKESRKLPRCYYLGPFPKQKNLLYHVGFGYDEFNDDFKVVRLTGVRSKAEPKRFTKEGKIYSLKSNRWKPIENIPYMIHRDTLSIRCGGYVAGANFPASLEPCMTRSISVHGCSELICQSSMPVHQDEKLEGVECQGSDISRAVSRRDMATQMSPEGSPHSSSRHGSSFSPSTPILPIVELQSVHSSKPEIRDVQVDERVTMTRWSKKHRVRVPRRGSGNADDCGDPFCWLECFRDS